MTTTSGSKLKHAIIGVGAGVFNMHRPALELEAVKVVGVADINAEAGHQRANELGCAFYTDHRAMLSETKPDIAVILTPHPSHAAIAIDCLQAGAHVLVEKPMAVQAAEADAMVEAAATAGRLLAVNFQHRNRADVRTARKLIQQGALGQLQHVAMTAAWPRTARYFKVVPWRGTWVGEGGGVLKNQAPHQLDILCHLFDLPARVLAWTRTKLHDIEAEDTVQAMMEWPSGMLGSFHVSTAEVGCAERLEIVGTGGSLQFAKDGALTYERLKTDFRTFRAESDNPFGQPAKHAEAVELEAGSGDHVAIYQNLHEAILSGVPLTCDGVEGRKSLELANAMILSSYTGSEIGLPLDRQRYATLLEGLKAEGK
ncbi:MAG: Gfo/Idh/MocA family oxidoreductase [Truepera sp.]|nr:Gfo/Idh/MocA family oxidoreductase [Truepera sp.]